MTKARPVRKDGPLLLPTPRSFQAAAYGEAMCEIAIGLPVCWPEILAILLKMLYGSISGQPRRFKVLPCMAILRDD